MTSKKKSELWIGSGCGVDGDQRLEEKRNGIWGETNRRLRMEQGVVASQVQHVHREVAYFQLRFKPKFRGRVHHVSGRIEVLGCNLTVDTCSRFSVNVSLVTEALVAIYLSAW